MVADRHWCSADVGTVSNKKKSGKRIAEMEIRAASVEIQAQPGAKSARTKSMKVWAVEVREVGAVPKGEAPICWRLLTTHRVETLDDAKRMAKWYAKRWNIEDLFRILKSEGLNVESSQFESGAALQKLILVALDEALMILLMRQEREGAQGLDASYCFSEDQITALEVLGKPCEGKTTAQRNPFNRRSLAWAAWFIARMGGWLPRQMDKRPPGVTSYKRGLHTFFQRYQGWIQVMDSMGRAHAHSP